PRRRPQPGAAGRGRPPQPLPLRAAVQAGHRAAAAPVRHHAPRRAGQATPASRDQPVPGRNRRTRRLLGPKPVLPALQASRGRHPWAVPDARKNRLKGRKPRQETAERPPYHSPGAAWAAEVFMMPTTTGMKGAGYYDQHSTPQLAAIRALQGWVDDAV